MIANMLIHVIDVECVGPYSLRVWFDDNTVKDIDLSNELWGRSSIPCATLNSSSGSS